MVCLALALNNLPYISSDLLDLKKNYSLKEVLDLFNKFGLEGRRIYIASSSILDTLFPIAYASFFSCIIFMLVKDISILKYLILVPPMTALVDLMENFQIINLLIQYPDFSSLEVVFASLTTRIKHFFVILQYTSFMFAILVRIYLYFYQLNKI